MTCDTWQMTHEIWHVTSDMWHVTHDMWHMTCDMWHATHGGRWTFSQNFRSLAHTVVSQTVHPATAAWDEKTSVKLEILCKYLLDRVLIALSFHGNYALLVLYGCTRTKSDNGRQKKHLLILLMHESCSSNQSNISILVDYVLKQEFLFILLKKV